MKRSSIAAVAAVSLTVPAAAAASDTVSYTYDALGRITDVATTGGSNDGQAAATRYDPAGNRTSYGVSGVAPAGLAAGSQSSSSGELTTGLQETMAGLAQDGAEEVPPALVEPPPPGGIPDESEPVVEIDAPEGGAR